MLNTHRVSKPRFDGHGGAHCSRSGPHVPSLRMATSIPGTELRGWADLMVIQRAQEAMLPEVDFWEMGLMDIAELCRRDYIARPGRDPNDVRDQVRIAIEWDLESDRLDQQSEICLRDIAEFLLT
jgi:hypothetical protein